jgi:ketosteroid isomerase-like protein
MTPAGVPFESTHKRVLEASHSGELTDLLALFADDAVLMPPNDTTLYGKEEITEWWKEYFQWFQVNSSIETEGDLVVAGDQAFQRFSLSVVIVPRKKGTRITDDVRTLTVWRRQADGSWKISHQMWNSTKPVGSGTNRYMSKMVQRKNT